MYDRTYDTDWEELSLRDACERAYAVGVSTALTEEREARERLETEYARLRAAMETGYDRDLVELALAEGRNAVAAYRSREGPASAEAAWEHLVETSVPNGDAGGSPDGDPGAGPPSVLDPPGRSGPQTGEIGAIRLPDLLTRLR